MRFAGMRGALPDLTLTFDRNDFGTRIKRRVRERAAAALLAFEARAGMNLRFDIADRDLQIAARACGDARHDQAKAALSAQTASSMRGRRTSPARFSSDAPLSGR